MCRSMDGAFSWPMLSDVMNAYEVSPQQRVEIVHKAGMVESMLQQSITKRARDKMERERQEAERKRKAF